jgi:hypothetical protein
MHISPFLPRGVTFDSKATTAMSDAFESAWRVVQYAGLLATKEAVAAKIIAAASRGERDSELLRDAALSELGLHR